MIGHLCVAVATDLHTRKFPHRVVYGPERVGRDGFEATIVFKRDRSANEAIEGAKGANGINPNVPFQRYVSGSFTVYARSPKGGATVLDHEDECDVVCDGVLSAMYRILAIKRLPLRVTGSKLLTRDELRAETEVSAADDHSGQRSAEFPGCAARVTFAVGTNVRDVTYTNAARPTGEVFDVDAPIITSEGFDDYDPAPDEEIP